jgi:hypothetical protein
MAGSFQREATWDPVSEFRGSTNCILRTWSAKTCQKNIEFKEKEKILKIRFKNPISKTFFPKYYRQGFGRAKGKKKLTKHSSLMGRSDFSAAVISFFMPSTMFPWIAALKGSLSLAYGPQTNLEKKNFRRLDKKKRK